MNEYDELDSIVDAWREKRRNELESLGEFVVPVDTLLLSAQEEARIAEFQHGQPVTWDRYASIDDSDWRTHGGLA